MKYIKVKTLSHGKATENHRKMANLFPYITEDVLKAIQLISTIVKEHKFDGIISITSEEYTIFESKGQAYSYTVSHQHENTQESQMKIFDMITEINRTGSDFYPPPLVYQYDQNTTWKSQVLQTLQDIIEHREAEATQLQKYYHLGQLFKNKPAEYHRQLRALKFELGTVCKTRTVQFHLRIAKRTRKIFEKKGLQHLHHNIDITPSEIGYLKEEDFKKILDQI
jgi:hypothetical protein